MNARASSDEEILLKELERNGFQRNARFKTVDGAEYTFQFWSPRMQILLELYPRKPPEQIRISPEYDQLYFLVELHIKLVHRKFPGVKINEAIAVGSFSARAQEYVSVHGGMKILTPSQALEWLGRVS